MKIRAKFRCESVTNYGEGGEEVKLRATNSTDGDNVDWSKWTPSGDLSMHITNEGARGAFEPGKSYWLDISPVE